jgi:hypothetical protein
MNISSRPSHYNPHQREGIKAKDLPTSEVMQKLKSFTPEQWYERVDYLASLPDDEYVKADQYLDDQYIKSLPLHKQVGKVIGDNVAKVGQWFKEQMPERKPKESVDYGPVDIGDL